MYVYKYCIRIQNGRSWCLYVVPKVVQKLYGTEFSVRIEAIKFILRIFENQIFFLSKNSHIGQKIQCSFLKNSTWAPSGLGSSPALWLLPRIKTGSKQPHRNEQFDIKTKKIGSGVEPQQRERQREHNPANAVNLN